MVFAYVILLVSLIAAGVAGVFSVFGMMAIFAGQPLVGLAAGITVEVVKLAGVSFLYRYWKDGVWFRIPFAIGVSIAMLVTSIGVFGMLSKAHSDQGAPVANSTAKIELLDTKILSEQSKIANATAAIQQMDSQIQVLIKHDKIMSKGGTTDLLATQKDSRESLNDIIDSSQSIIDVLQTEKLELSQVIRDFETEVGPIKYFAELVYSDQEDSLDRALRLIIILIMLVLDPMAIMLLMGYNHIAMGNKITTATILSKPATVSTAIVDSIQTVEEKVNTIGDDSPDPSFMAQFVEASLDDVIPAPEGPPNAVIKEHKTAPEENNPPKKNWFFAP